MVDFLKILFPQWQGSGTNNDLYYGAFEIRDAFLPENSYKQIDVSIGEELTVKNGILGFDSIVIQLENANSIILDHKPKKIFTIGGDCGVEIAPVSYLNELYKGDFLVIWFDAHGDLNTPGSSPSKNFHGMPLRFLLGDGDKNITERAFSTLTSDQIVMVGCRELDPLEEEFIYDNNIQLIPAGNLKALIDVIRLKDTKNLYIHVDLDVLDPKSFSSVICPTENGITLDDLIGILKLLRTEFNLVGFSVVEYKQSHGKYIDKLRDIIQFGYSL